MKLRYKYIIVLFCLVILIYILHPFLLESLARFLVAEDNLVKADVIVVLSGDGNGERMVEAARLFKDNYAKWVLISGGQFYWKTTYAGIMKKHAQALSIPPESVLIEDKSESTYENAKFCLPIIKQKGFRSILLVTSPTHSRRARHVFLNIYDKEGVKIISHPVRESRFKVKRWWTRHEDTQKVVLEYVKLLGYVLKGW
ncbi:YdcF family protein [Candidatus Margulisiibacteriota bacterium]